MKKIAFVVVRYGVEVNGGAEYHCRMLAERLVGLYEVHVLTTNLKTYASTGKTNVYDKSEEVINGVHVRRFPSSSVRLKVTPYRVWVVRYIRSLRLYLYKCGLLTYFANQINKWTISKRGEIYLNHRSVFYSSELLSFVRKHKDDFDVFIPITVDYPLSYYTIKYVGEKSIFIPTLHYHKHSFYPHLVTSFTKAGYIGFNTGAEEKLAEEIFGKKISPHGLISVGYEMGKPANWERTVEKFSIPEEYLLYVGRVDKSKMDKIFKYFFKYKKKYRATSRLKLVLVGGLFMEKIYHPDVIYTGFVSEEEKVSLIAHAKIIVNPSIYESLSLILLEALSLKKAMLVNKKCNVMCEHYEKSGKAVAMYDGKESFVSELHRLDTSDALRQEMGEKGAKYVAENYNWDLIMHRLTEQIEHICEKTKGRS